MFFKPKAEDLTAQAQKRADTLTAAADRAMLDLEAAYDELGVLAADEDTPPAELATARARYEEATRHWDEAQAAAAAADRQLQAHRAAATGVVHKRARAAVRAAHATTVRAAEEFDAALRVAAEAWASLAKARDTEHTAARTAGERTRTPRAGYDEVAALFHVSPQFGIALRKRMREPLPPTNRHFRPMADAVRRAPDAEEE